MNDIPFKSISKYRILLIEDLPQNLLIKDSLINFEYLENKTGKIALSTYLIPISEVISNTALPEEMVHNFS